MTDETSPSEIYYYKTNDASKMSMDVSALESLNENEWNALNSY